MYFEDVKKCVAIDPVPDDPNDPNNTNDADDIGNGGAENTNNKGKDNRDSSADNNADNNAIDSPKPCGLNSIVESSVKQPPPETSCGDPINPGNGNNWVAEVDIPSYGLSGGAVLKRTYNSTPYTANNAAVGTFGSRWTHAYSTTRIIRTTDSRVPGGGGGGGTCYRRRDNGKIVWCGSSLIWAEVFGLVRPDGKIYKFYSPSKGSASMLDANPPGSITPNYRYNGEFLGWTYKDRRTGNTEFYDASGLLLWIASRSGAVERLTYNTSQGNDTSVFHYPEDAPGCTNVQPGIGMILTLPVCTTDSWGRSIQFEYDRKGRITKAIDPSNQVYLYAYDGPSGGCLTPDSSLDIQRSITDRSQSQTSFKKFTNNSKKA
jgi:hypothetical protein